MLREEHNKDGGKWYLASGLLAASIASLCCIGPPSLIALGIGGLAAASAFEPLRPLFASIAIIALAFAWRRTLKRSSCASGGRGASGNRKILNITLLSLATALSVGLLAFPLISESLLEARNRHATAVQAEGERLVASIPSMDCSSCALTIQRKVADLAGVESADINYPTKLAEITYDPTKIDEARILEAIESTGFPPERIDK